MKITLENNINEILPKDIHKSEKTSDSTFENILNNKIEDLKFAKPGIEESLSVNKTANLLLIPLWREKKLSLAWKNFLISWKNILKNSTTLILPQKTFLL